MLDKYENSFNFTGQEEKKGKGLLKELGIKSDDKFVCINVRDGAFLEDYFNKRIFLIIVIEIGILKILNLQ